MVTDTRLDPREHLYIGPTGFRFAPSGLTLDDLEGSKIKVILFDMKYVKNGNSYDVGPNRDYRDCPWASLWMTLKCHRSRSQSFDSKYLENSKRYKVGPWEHLHIGTMGFQLSPSDLTLDDLERSRIKVILFNVKYVKNGNSYDVGHNGDYTECPWASFWMTLRGYGDRHVEIYASMDNRQTCLILGYCSLHLYRFAVVVSELRDFISV